MSPSASGRPWSASLGNLHPMASLETQAEVWCCVLPDVTSSSACGQGSLNPPWNPQAHVSGREGHRGSSAPEGGSANGQSLPPLMCPRLVGVTLVSSCTAGVTLLWLCRRVEWTPGKLCEGSVGTRFTPVTVTSPLERLHSWPVRGSSGSGVDQAQPLPARDA